MATRVAARVVRQRMAVLALWGMARVELQLLQHIELEWTKEMPQLLSEQVVSPSVGKSAETTEQAHNSVDAQAELWRPDRRHGTCHLESAPKQRVAVAAHARRWTRYPTPCLCGHGEATRSGQCAQTDQQGRSCLGEHGSGGSCLRGRESQLGTAIVATKKGSNSAQTFWQKTGKLQKCSGPRSETAARCRTHVQVLAAAAAAEAAAQKQQYEVEL